MTEFNLLPDIKLQYLKTKRLEHSIVSLSLIVSAVSLAVFITMFIIVDVGQKNSIHNLNNQISSSSNTLNSDSDLNQILTVQHQLATLPQLESQTPQTSRLFSYISQLTPATATISSLNIDFTANDVTVTGGADTLATVNTFVDTLKFATYKNGTSSSSSPAFNTVVLSSFSYDNTSTTGQPAQYTITFNFDPTIFNSADTITLSVPNEITTRSILNQPQLFKAAPTN